MGYVLPINSYRSQQYANRLVEEPHFARISQLHRITPVASFQERFDRVIADKDMYREKLDEEKKKKKSTSAQVPSQNRVLNYTHPNPANLSPAIAQVVGKGANINTYV